MSEVDFDELHLILEFFRERRSRVQSADMPFIPSSLEHVMEGRLDALSAALDSDPLVGVPPDHQSEIEEAVRG
jgi:hypothetical protein